MAPRGLSLRGLRILALEAKGRSTIEMWNAVWMNETLAPGWRVERIGSEGVYVPGSGEWSHDLYTNLETGEQLMKQGRNVQSVFVPPVGCTSLLDRPDLAPESGPLSLCTLHVDLHVGNAPNPTRKSKLSTVHLRAIAMTCGHPKPLLFLRLCDSLSFLRVGTAIR